MPDAGQVAVVDLAASKQVATWRVPGLKATSPWRSTMGALLATVFRSPPQLVLLNTKTGAVTASCPPAATPTTCSLMEAHRIYVSCGEGMVDVVQQGAEGSRPPHLEVLSEVDLAEMELVRTRPR